MRIFCHFNSGNDIWWTKDGRVLPGYVLLKPQVLKIVKARSADSGRYICNGKKSLNQTYQASSYVL